MEARDDMKRVFLALALTGLTGLAAASASGQEGHPRPPHSGGMSEGMGGMMGGTMMGGGPEAERPWISLALQQRDQLGLTTDQVTQLESLRAEFEKEAIRRSADIQVAETELAELLRAEQVDLTKVEAALGQLEGLRTDLRLSRIKILEQGKALLTPEQRKKLVSLSPRASADPAETMMAGRGMEEMHRFMHSERMPRAMAGMMEMARQMGNGDSMAGMVRMMEMMSMVGQMGEGTGAQPGGHMGGMMTSPGQPKVSP
jgi:Spy/CpxP family protein refolding chaperone